MQLLLEDEGIRVRHKKLKKLRSADPTMKTWTIKFEVLLTMSLVNVKNVAIVVDFDGEMGGFVDEVGRSRRRRAAENKGPVSLEVWFA